MDHEDRTVWCGNISENMTEELLYELFLQAAPLERVSIPQAKGGRKSNYAFIVLKHAMSVPYVVQLLDGISIFDKSLNIKPRNRNQMNEVHHPYQSSVKDRLGIKVDEPHRNNAISPFVPVPTAVVDMSPYFQNLLQMGQMMNVSAMQNNYMSSFDSQQSSHRGNRSSRNNRRGEHSPYNRNDRHGKSHDRNYDNHRRHRHY